MTDVMTSRAAAMPARSDNADVVVLGLGSLTSVQSRALKIVAFLGVEADVVVRQRSDNTDDVKTIALPRCRCLIVDADTLAAAADELPAGASGLADLISNAEHVFVYGFRPHPRHVAILRVLSGQQLIGLASPAPNSNFEVAHDTREWTAQFSGIDVRSVVDPDHDSTFVEAPGCCSHATLIRADARPFFVRNRLARMDVFLVGCTELADLDESVSRNCNLLSRFSRLMPLMMFLRATLKERVWHNPNPRACFIIDDPLLRPRYGFLDYDRLADSVRRGRFAMSIAFIPWNYRRSSRAVAGLFRSTAGMTALCVHGCDHTRGEFATTDVDLLRGKAALALRRMTAHRRLSGAPYVAVMVFPQGLFSRQAMVALRDAGYLAAVNSDAFPANSTERIPIREMLEVAVCRMADFPLFVRHYPGDFALFAFDLFLGKPALAVEHHGYFRHGCMPVEDFARRLADLNEGLEWSDLGTICSRASLTQIKNGVTIVRFFTSPFCLTNTSASNQHYQLFRHLPSHEAPHSVLVDGKEAAFEQSADRVTLHVALAPGQSVTIRIIHPEVQTGSALRKVRQATSVLVRLRRYLSEIRDNYVHQSPTLTRGWSILQRLAATIALTATSVARHEKRPLDPSPRLNHDFSSAARR